MKKLIIQTVLVLAACYAHGQGTLQFDQQSATSPLSSFGNDFFDIQTEPLTQSFVPTLSTISFVQFEFWDIPNNGNNGATVYVNLWTGSPNINSATLLGSTASVYMPNGFMNNNLGLAGLSAFYFSDPITLTLGQTYYLQPVVLSGDDPWDIMVLGDVYPDGRLYGNGSFFQPGADFWFREGIVSVPEPTVLALFGLTGLLVLARRRCRNFLLVAYGHFSSLRQNPRVRAPTVVPRALAIRVRASTEMFSTPRSTWLIKTVLSSAFSASFSWLRPDCLRAFRTASPKIRRCCGRDTACNKSRNRHFELLSILYYFDLISFLGNV